MSERKKIAWRIVKLLFGLAVVAAIGWRFAQDLSREELRVQSLQPGWLLLAGVLYLAALALSALYWKLLLARLGSPTVMLGMFRAYYVGHLGKYLPGKAWALLLRAGLAKQAGAPAGRAGLTAFYEVLVTMGSGALVAAMLFAIFGSDAGLPSREALWSLLRLDWPPDEPPGRALCVLLCLLLACATLVPLLPGVFNRVVERVSMPFRDPQQVPPRFTFRYLVEGLVITAPGWLLLGLALAAALRSVAGDHFEWSPALIGRLTAAMGLSYVAGFILLLAPGGIGVREFFLTLLVVPEMPDSQGARAKVILAVLALRLVWTLAELIVAAGLYWLPVAVEKPTLVPGGSS